MTTAHNKKQLDRLKGLLKELFQLDKPELDFGLYKIMHAKSAQITQFLENDLLQEIEAAFGAESEGRVQQAQLKVTEAIDQAKKFGAPDPEATSGVKEARAAYKLALEGGNTQAEIYDHLYRFFERYYDNGDFLSKRYYARENDSRAAPYSVPYDGREVYLHWANKDQYYIKSSEYLSNFSFDLNEAVRQNRSPQATDNPGFDFGEDTHTDTPPLKVHMHLAQAQEGEHGNIKAAGDQKREFIPLLSNPVEFNALGELVLNFEYKVQPEGYPIDSDTEAALKAAYDFKNKGDVPAHWMADVFLKALSEVDPQGDKRYAALLAQSVPTETQKKRPLLAKYIQQYTARNTMDYFIHKDLGGFLRRELDFYIKNELMRLDDIESAEAPRVEDYLRKIKALRRIAHQLIAFLAQLEDFQKKLWLKKKFVTETQYCITLDRVPESLYPAIAANDAQREEWVKLFAIDEIVGDTAQVGYSVPLTVVFLKQNPYLMIDTAMYVDDFKTTLLSNFENLDKQCDGTLINSENFQALALMQMKYQQKIQGIYIDPPYNTGADDFNYKDNYQRSSWLSMLNDRISLSKKILSNSGTFAASIDFKEVDRLTFLLDETFGPGAKKNSIVIKRGSATGAKVINPGVVNVSENILLYSKTSYAWEANKVFKQKEYDSRYGSFIENFEEDFFDWRFSSVLDQFAKFIGVKKSALKKELGESYSEKLEEFVILNANKIIRLASLDDNSISADAKLLKKESKRNPGKVFRLPRDDANDYYIIDGNAILFYKHRLISVGGRLVPGEPVTDIWDDVLPNDLHNEGGVALRKGKKPEKLISRLIEISSNKEDIILDFFVGSGTSAAVAQKTGRMWVGVEQADYFDDVTKARLSKTLYGDKSGVSSDFNWRGGGAFKYLRLESYEDTLNNLSLQSDPARERALADNPSLREDYVLNYWLDVETQGSQSLLNVANFRDPTAYTMRIKQPGSDVQRLQRIDLIETFNWLIGLWVEHMAAPQTFEAEFARETDPLLPKDQNTRLVCTRTRQADAGPYWFRLVEGYTLKVPGDDTSRQKTLVVWRKLTDNPEQDNAVLQHFLMEKLAISPREQTYAVIYVNGSHTLPNPVVEGEQTKVRLIEEAFHQAMWSQDGA